MIEQKQVDSTNEHLEKETHLVKSVADLTKLTVKWLEIEHGDNDKGGYVFHFSDHHQQRTLPKSDEGMHRVYNIITNHLEKLFSGKDPEILAPPEGWEKKVISIIVPNWNSEDVSFDEDRVERALNSIGEEVSEIIEAIVVRRKF